MKDLFLWRGLFMVLLFAVPVVCGAKAAAAGEKPEAFPNMRALWDREPEGAVVDPQDQLFRQAEKNGRAAAEAFYRCRRYIDGWLAYADPTTGLIPRNLKDSRDYWNGRDSGADNYPFMVLTAAMTDRPLLDGRLLEVLRTETRQTCRIDRLPDDYSFSKKGWRREKLDLDAIIFEGAEYVKDGLLYVAEWMGPSPWTERMVGIIDDIWKNAAIETPAGKIPTLNFEVNGDLLQACSRLFWFTGDPKYLDWAIRLGDYYLLGDHHPTRNSEKVALRDHGCEVINGLTELYVAVTQVRPEKRQQYQEPLRAMFDTILARGLNEHGMMYTYFNPATNAHDDKLSDNWGYNYDGVYTMYLLDKVDAYRDAVRHALHDLPSLIGYWHDMDNLADSVEGAITLYNHEPIPEAVQYIDAEMRSMWSIQRSDGVIEAWHGDGNFARTSLMYALWKTQGLHIEPWRPDVCVGAVRDGKKLLVSLHADQSWEGQLIGDQARHKTYMHLPLDYPRINQFPEWTAFDPTKEYSALTVPDKEPAKKNGAALLSGLPITLKPDVELRLILAEE